MIGLQDNWMGQGDRVGAVMLSVLVCGCKWHTTNIHMNFSGE